jgi:hypothetical protein
MRARTILGGCLAAVLLATAAPTASADDHGHDRGDDRGRRARATARAATHWFHNVDVADAAGYALPPDGPLHECIENLDGPGAMGLHYINGEFASDTKLDPKKPEALVYEPLRNGRLKLVAVEYVVFAEAWDAEHPDRPPRLFGHDLMLVPEPNRYELPAFYQIHAWVWKHNPDGVHADFNPRVSCDAGGRQSRSGLRLPQTV